MNKLFLLLLAIISLIFVSAPTAKAEPNVDEVEPNTKAIRLGTVFVQKEFPYEYQGKVEDSKSEFGLYIFEFEYAENGYIYVGIQKESKLILFYHFRPKNLKIEKVIEFAGEDYTIVPNGIVYKELGFFAEINSKKEVVMIGRFLVTKDI